MMKDFSIPTLAILLFQAATVPLFAQARAATTAAEAVVPDRISPTWRLPTLPPSLASSTGSMNSARPSASRSKNSPPAIFLAVNSLLELGRREEARIVIAKAQSAPDDDSLDYLGEAAASVHSAFGNHAEAWQIRRSLPCTSPVSRNIVEGMVQSSLALAISDLDTRLDQLAEREHEAAFDETSLTVPGNQSGLNEETRAVYQKWRQRLIRLFPTKDLQQHNLENRSL